MAKRKKKSKKTSLLNNIKKNKKLQYMLAFAIVGVLMLGVSFAQRPDSIPRAFENRPERGLNWADLKRPSKDSICEKLFEVVDRNGKPQACTHGPDPAPSYIDVRDEVEPLTIDDEYATPQESPVVCDGNGVDGYRVEALYVHASDKTSSYNDFLASFRQYAANVDQAVAEESAKFGVSKRVRFVTNSNCEIVVHNITVDTAADDSFSNTISAVKAKGFDKVNRKYLMWVEDTRYCGIGSLYPDDNPSQDNYNNGIRAQYSRVDKGCWNRSEMHELFHNMGAVQNSSPNSSGGYHCNDEYDVMCYPDGGSTSQIVYDCPDSSSRKIDCNNNDYFHPSPAAGSYLDTHWNIADSRFLINGGDVEPTPDPDPDPIPDPDTNTGGDTTPPTINITSPTADEVIDKFVEIVASATDDTAVAKIEIYIDGSLEYMVTDSNAYYKWNAMKAALGTHTITIKAYDSSGNESATTISVYKNSTSTNGNGGGGNGGGRGNNKK